MRVKPFGQDGYADEALALDYALGILIEPDLAYAQRRMGTEASFALLVARYRVRLGSGAFEYSGAKRLGQLPSVKTWSAIMAKIACLEDR